MTSHETVPRQTSSPRPVMSVQPSTKIDPCTLAAPFDPAFRVNFDSGDREDPRNFPTWYKLYITVQLGALTFAGALGSSIMVPGQAQMAKEMHTSAEVAVLATSLYIFGWVVGPTLWGPISEVYGRKWGMLPAVLFLGVFSIGSATSKNLTSVFITRFLGGVFGSAPVSNASAALNDLYSVKARGAAVNCMAVVIAGGPTLGPLIGSALVNNPNLGWRWTLYVEAICAFVVFACAILTLPETYPPVVLRKKAQRMRKLSGDQRFWHPQERECMKMKFVTQKYLIRPLRLLGQDPILGSIALYASFTYSLIYLSLQVYPIVFEEQRRYTPIISCLPLLGVLVGVIIAMAINLLSLAGYISVTAINRSDLPGSRLPPMLIGAALLPVGLFWFAWTADPAYSWVLPTIAGSFVGTGFNMIFQQCVNLLIDMYGPFAASALSANTILRSLMAAALPLAARPMIHTMGVGPAMSLLGGIACLALPIPLIFMKYGSTLYERPQYLLRQL